MRIEDINRDRDTFLQHIQNSLEPELKKIGLVLINVNITDITDESGYIDAIGQKAASQAIQQARGDVADEVKQGEIRVADAERDKVVQVANATKQREIGTREAQREQAVRVAELEKEQTVGEQTAAFQRDVAGQAGRAGECVSPIAEANAKAVDGENIADAKIAAVAGRRCSCRRPKPTRTGEVAQARGRGGRASKFRTARWPRRPWPRPNASKPSSGPSSKRRPRPRRPASSSMPRPKPRSAGSKPRARRRRSYAKLEAEARGQYEILAKKGEGLKQIVEACGGAQQAFQLLMLEHLDNLAEASAKAICNIKFDKVVVWENGGANGRSNTADFLHKMAGTLPPMMQVMRDIGGVEIPDSLAQAGGRRTRSKTDGNGHVRTARARGEADGDEEAPVATATKPRV